MYDKEKILEAINNYSYRQDFSTDVLSYVSNRVKIPKKFTLYDEQLSILIEFMNAVEDGNKVFVCNFPTGIGKSLLANCMIILLKYYKYIKRHKQSIIVTHQKLLQNQYEKDFNYLVDIRGKSSYFCLLDFKDTVDKAKCALVKDFKCPAIDQCPYYCRRNTIFNKEATIVSTNYSWYLTYYNSIWGYDKALGCQIFDEAHIIEDVLIDKHKIDLNTLITSLDNINNVYKFDPNRTFIMLNNVKSLNDIIIYLDLIYKRLDGYREFLDFKGVLDNYNYLMFIRDNLLEYYNDDNITYEVVNGILLIKPISELVRRITNHSEYTIFLSSTVAENYVRKNLVNNCYFMERPSLFNIESRRIYCFKTLFRLNSDFFMDKEDVVKWLTVIDWIINQYPDVRGVIFTSSFYMASLLKYSNNKDRLLIHDDSIGGRTLSQLFETFKNSKNKILVSPSISTGFDFKDDLSRFQILSKIPYLNYNSEERIVYGDEYYFNSTMNKVIQMTGRSIRSKDDYATTYILDGSLPRLIENSHPPKWWTDSVSYV